MPPKKQPAKKVAAKKAAVKKAAPAKKKPVKKAPAKKVAPPDVEGRGSISFWFGRLNWEFVAEGKEGKLVMVPASRADYIHRVSLVADFGVPLEDCSVAMGSMGYRPSLGGSRASLRLQPDRGVLRPLVWEVRASEGFSGPPRIEAGP